ncbi:MAG: hypothetical protein ACRDOU_17110 [Streptosporangiaceae bacterium]
MMRTTDDPSPAAPRNWSGTSTLILLVFLALGTFELHAHHTDGAVIGFVLAAVYVPLRILRSRLLRRR